jgi:hypothetical protein
MAPPDEMDDRHSDIARIDRRCYETGLLRESKGPRSVTDSIGGCRSIFGEVSMSQVDERSYLLNRERACREMAGRTSDSIARGIHLEMAERYAEKAAQLERPILQATG